MGFLPNIAQHNRYYLCEDPFKRIIGTLVDIKTVDKCYKNQVSVQYFNLQYFTHNVVQELY